MLCPIRDSAKPEPYDMVRAKIASGAVSQQISIISNLIMGLPISNKDRTKYLRSGISVTTSLWQGSFMASSGKAGKPTQLTVHEHNADIDVQRSDMKTLFHLIDLCNSTLPSMSRDLEIKIGQKDW